jgi:large repetitive protein
MAGWSKEHRSLFKLALVLVGVLAAVAVTGASAADFEGDTGPCHETPGDAALLRCPTAYVGSPYVVQIAVEEGSGCDPYVWFEIVNGALPTGLTMSRDGVISGTPTGAGLTRFWLWLHDLTQAEGGPSFCQRDDVSQREFSIPVDPGLAIVNASVTPGTVGQPYNDTLTTKQVVTLSPPDGPNVQATWSVESGALPPGVSLSPSGALTGTPTSEGSYQFTVKAQNGSPFDTKTYTLSVRQPLTVKSPLVSAQHSSAEVGIRFATTVTATGGAGTYTWSLASGSLPAGVALNTATGAIAGTPRAAGSFAFAVKATDADGRAATANAALTIAPKLTLKTLRLKAARVGRSYQARLTTAGGVRPLNWRASGKLPPGVRFVKSLGALTGTPRRTGTFRITVQARDALGARSQKTLALVVRA